MPRSDVRNHQPSDGLTSVLLGHGIHNGNGFVWYTTGSGKTLTFFKSSTLATLRDALLPKLLGGEFTIPMT
jgi:hypothetical protein